MKRTYHSPLAKPTEVEFEQALLVATARLLLDVDLDRNMNIMEQGATQAPDAAGGEMYFEF